MLTDDQLEIQQGKLTSSNEAKAFGLVFGLVGHLLEPVFAAGKRGMW